MITERHCSGLYEQEVNLNRLQLSRSLPADAGLLMRQRSRVRGNRKRDTLKFTCNTIERNKMYEVAAQQSSRLIFPSRDELLGIFHNF
jgi:hypothetical protein